MEKSINHVSVSRLFNVLIFDRYKKRFCQISCYVNMVILVNIDDQILSRKLYEIKLTVCD